MAGGTKGLPKACRGTAGERLKAGRVETAEVLRSSAAEGAEMMVDAAEETQVAIALSKHHKSLVRAPVIFSPLTFPLLGVNVKKKAKLSSSLFSIFLAITRAVEKIIACISSGMQPAPGRSQSAVIELPNHIIRAGLH
ncbi:hypothetical protein MHYP_G00342350 [Metynnis hypsauchen]